jgi:hypothetical protein
MNFTKRCIIHETASSLTSSLSSTRHICVYVLPGLVIYRRVPKFWTKGSVRCACAQRPGLPHAWSEGYMSAEHCLQCEAGELAGVTCARLRQAFSRTLRSQKHNIFQWAQHLGTPRYGLTHHETQHVLVNESFVHRCYSPLLDTSKWWLVVGVFNSIPLTLPLLNTHATRVKVLLFEEVAPCCCRYIAPLSRQVVLTVLQEILKSYRTVRLDFLAEVCMHHVSWQRLLWVV